MTYPSSRRFNPFLGPRKPSRSAPRRRKLLAEQLEKRHLLAGDILLSSGFVYEKLPLDSPVGDLGAVNPDGTAPYTFELVAGEGGEDNASFRVDSEQLVTAATLDDEVQSVYSVRVRATDSLGEVTEKAFQIDVLDTDGEYHDVIGTSANEIFTAQYVGSGTNEWLVRRGGSTVFNGELATPTTKLRILATSGTDTLSIIGSSGDDTFVVSDQATEVNGFTVISQSVETRQISASGGNDTLIGPDTNSLWTIDDRNDGTLNTTTSFYDVESLVGGSADDTFQFKGANLIFDYLDGTLDAGAGHDTLDYSQTTSSVLVSWNTNRATGVGRSATLGAATGFEAVIGSEDVNPTVEGPDSVNQWTITGENTGTINNGQYSFTNVARLLDGPQEDVFIVENGGSISGYLNAAGDDRIELTDRGVPLDVNISNRNISGVLNSYTAGELLIEGDQDNRLLGSTGSLTVQINADGTVNANDVHYSAGFDEFVGGTGYERLYAPPEQPAEWNITGEDTGHILVNGQRFDFTNAEILYGSDAVDSFTVQAGANWNGNLLGQGGNDVFTIIGGVSVISAGDGTDTLHGPDIDSVWTIDDRNDGTLNTTTSFYDVESLVGGSADDTFQFKGANLIFDYLDGTLDAGAGHDTLDYSQTTSSVLVSWNTNRATGVGRSATLGAATGFEAVIGSEDVNPTVEGPDSVNQWTITGENTGTINNGQYSFTNVARLLDGPQEDVFIVENGGSISGYLNAAGDDRIELTDRGVPLDVNISNRNISGVLNSYTAGELLIEGDQDNRLLGSTGSLTVQINADGTVNANDVHYSAGFDEFVGGTGYERLYAPPEQPAEWNITGEDTGHILVNGQRFDFTNAEILYGSDAVDSFTVQAGANWNGNLLGQGGNDVFTIIGGVSVISAGDGTDTLHGPDIDSVWTIDDRNDGTLNTTTSFYDVESLVGGSADDTFQFKGANLIFDYLDGTLDAGAGHDTLDYSQTTSSVLVSWNTNRATGVGRSATLGAATGFEAVIGSEDVNPTVEGPDSVNQWTITGENTGTINNGQYSFTNVARLLDGPQEDVFIVENGGSISGYLNAAGDDRIELTDRGVPLDVNISNRNISGVLNSYTAGELLIEGDQDNRLLGSTGSLTVQINADGTVNANDVHYSAGFDEFVGGTGYERLYAPPEQPAEWNITGEDTGHILVNGQRFDFTNAEILYGSDAVDSFTVQAGANWNGNLLGQGGNDVFTIIGGVSVISAGDGTDTLHGPDIDSVWTIDDRNDGTLNTTTSFYDVESLVGGSADDTFQFKGANLIFDYLDGTLDAGAGHDTLDYSQTTSSVLVSWNTNRATGVGRSATLGAATGFEAVIGSEDVNPTVEGPDSVNQWTITGENTGNINDGQYSFVNVGRLDGGPQEDVFTIESDGSYNGFFIGNGGTDRLELAARSEPLEVSVNSRSVPGVLGSYSLEKVVALAPADNQLLGSEANTNWQVTADGDIRVNSVTYTGFDSILGGSGNDTLLVDYTGENLEAALQIAFDGGSGGNDGLGFTGGSFQTVSYDPAQGTLQLNDVTFDLATGNLINLTNSSIANLLVDIDQTNLVANEVTTTFTAVDTNDTLLSFSESLGGILVRNVTGQLTVLGDAVDNDTITLAGIGNSLAANVVLDGRGGADQIAFDETIVLKTNDDLEVFAEQITIDAGVVVQTQGTGQIALNVDELNLDLTSTIQSADSVMLAPLSESRGIVLGTQNESALSLPSDLLHRIVTPSLIIGSQEVSGDITLGGDVILATHTDLEFSTTGDIFLAGTIDTAGGKLWLNPGAAPHAVHVGLTSNEVIASELSFAPNRDIRFTIDGTTPNTEYSQLSLLGSLDLTGVNLVIDGEYSVGLAESFVLIESDGTDAVLGTFKGLPESSFIDNFLGSSLSAQISYLGSDAATGNDIVLTVTAPPNVPPVADAGGPYEVNEGGAVQLNALNSRDPDASDETLVFHWDLDGDGVFGETGVGAERGDELGSNPDFDANHLNGPTSVTVAMRAIDLSGDSDTAYATVNVRNVAPTISLDTSIAVGRGETWTIDGSFVDPGPDIWTGTINYADGSGDQLLVLDGNEFELSHAYGAAGVYTAIVTIDDGEGGVTSKNLIVEVDLPPLADLTLISSDVLFDPINPGVGESFDFVVDVTNAGTLAASEVPVSIQVYDALTESFLEIGRGVLPSIDADPEGDAKSEAQVRLTWDGNNGQPALPTEDAYLLVRVVVDPDSTTEELDESNNEAIQVLQIGSPDFGSAELVAEVPDRTFYRDQFVAVGGQAFYDFSTIPGSNDFPVQNASVTARLIDSTGQVLAASGARTAPNGNFLHTMRSPKEDGDYTLRFEISDGTFSKVFESTLTVDGESPEPSPPRPSGPGGPGYVFSSSIQFVDDAQTTIPAVPPGNPPIGVPITILGSFDYELRDPLLNVPVTFNDLFPVAGQLHTFEIGSDSISFPEGGLADPALVGMQWTPTAEGLHIIQVIAKPDFRFKAHTHTTRTILVGDLDTTSLVVKHGIVVLPDSASALAPLAAARTFSAPLVQATNDAPEPGDTLSFTLSYENTGTTTITGGMLIDDFDETLMGTPTNISHGGIADGNILRWDLGDIAPGASGTVTYEVTINSGADFPPGAAFVLNTAVLNADQAVAASTSELVVSNNAPVITGLQVDEMLNENGDVTLSGTFSDASAIDTHTVAIDWGDGQTDTLTFSAGEREFSIPHSYGQFHSSLIESFSIDVNVTDQSHQSANDSVSTLVPANDQTAPSSSVLNATATGSNSYEMEVGFADPNGPDQIPVSGVSWVDVYYRVNPQSSASNTRLFGSFAVNPSVPSGSGTLSAVLDASPGDVIQLWSVATDAAGNIESEVTPRTDYSFVTADTVGPLTQVDSAVFDHSAFIDLVVSGTDVGGGNVDSIEVFVETDPGTENSAISLVGTIPGGANAVSGTIQYAVPQDGATHSYRFFSIGVDHLGNREGGSGSLDGDPGGEGDQLVTDVMLAAPTSGQIIGFDVNGGLENRSSVHSADLLFNDSGFIDELLESLEDANPDNDRIRLERLDLAGNSLGGEFLTVTAVRDGLKLRLDFGDAGLLPNGVYALRIDMDDDLSNGFEEDRRFHRLQGDINGDGVVNTADYAKVRRAYRNTALHADADVDGDGDVDGNDLRFYSTFLRQRDAEIALLMNRNSLDG
ncbi:PKD domain-containing protein [Rhodopirellula sp. P2]|uniref:PKD domain-containing protein n=1 Tax=Rhodopirellula sp. P2 TaxID=2127060 RepID=UPI002368DB42|nr:PKD domain-containing protein [Rhodopirellula sp. P2]WDQ17603.1 PKD domain-containing protein [Rhodopirellula sp. P2]